MKGKITSICSIQQLIYQILFHLIPATRFKLKEYIDPDIMEPILGK